jgi:prenylcysteine oxidase/farnesylcysteine lyase
LKLKEQDGTQFLYSTTVDKTRFSNYWDTLSAIRRYGPLSPLRTNRAVNALVKKFGNLYNPIFLAKRGVVDGMDSFAETIGLGKDLTTRFGADWAKSMGMRDRWIKEIMESSTRVNVSRLGPSVI